MFSAIYPIQLTGHQIRLLTIPAAASPSGQKPGHPALLDCTFEIVTLASNPSPSYIALSYVWGPAIFNKAVLINGQQAQITSSLYEALKNLQDPQSVVTIWADAICINQNDNEEKGEQVQMMNQIYKRASYVLVWLGPAADESDELMDTIDSLGTRALDSGLLYSANIDALQCLAFDNKRAEDDIPIGNGEHLVKEIGRSFPFVEFKLFMERPWWSRVWVVQEMTVGKRVVFVCGKKRVAPNQILACMYLEGKIRTSLLQQALKANSVMPVDVSQIVPAPSQTSAAIIFDSRLRYQQRPWVPEDHHMHLITLLVQFHVDIDAVHGAKLQATDDRDRVFALLGMADDSQELGCLADYSKDCVTVYTEVARKLLLRGRVDLLASSQLPKFESGTRLPSWVPDWTTHIDKRIGTSGYDSVYGAGTGRPACVKIGSAPNIILLSATLIDSVDQLGSVYRRDLNKGNHNAAMKNFLTEIKMMCAKSEVLQVPKEKEQAIWRIPIEDLQKNTSPAVRAPSSLGESYEALVEDFAITSDRRFLNLVVKRRSSVPIEGEDAVWFEEKIRRRGVTSIKSQPYSSSVTSTIPRVPFITKKGYVGLGPPHMQAKDKVYVVLGAAVPYIFRSVGSRKHYLVGSAYVHGIMDGEVFNRRAVVEDLEVI